MTWRRVLAATDFSAPSDAAVRIAHRIARRAGAELLLVHAMEPPAPIIAGPVMPLLSADAYRQSVAEHEVSVRSRFEHLRDAFAGDGDANGDGGGLAVSHTVVQGPPSAAIVGHAERWHPDLIVIGARGQSRSTRWLMGSVSRRVALDAPCPVLVVHERDDLEHDGAFHRVLAGIDYSSASRPVAEVALAVAHAGAIVELVHVWAVPSALERMLSRALGDASDLRERVRDHEVRALDEFASRLDAGTRTIRTRVDLGDAAEGLLDRGGAMGADVVVLGSHQRQSLSERLLGTVAERVLLHSAGPVLLVPTRAAASWSSRPGGRL